MRKKTHEEFVEQVYGLVGNEYTVLGEYNGNKIKVLIKHNNEGCNNYEWGITPNSFLKGNRCPVCAGNIKYTYEEIKDYINNLGYELINDYKNNSTKLILKDKDNFYYFISLLSLHNNHLPNKFDKSNPYTIQNIKLWCKLNNKSFELISDTYKGNIKKLKWKCLKEDCNEIFEMSWNDIYDGRGCAICSGHQVGLSNCLTTKRPDLAKEWHPTLNGELTPGDVTIGSNIYVWWKCSKNSKHEWYTSINNRNNGDNCPYCSGHLASEDYNLLKDNPKLCEEWDYESNQKQPEEYTPSSGDYAYWKCKECGHKWKTKISNRNKINGTGCPECLKSKGEKKIDEVLIKNNLIKISQEVFNKLIDKDKYNKNYFIPQMKYDDLLGVRNGLLSYDFYIPKLNLIIEYDGEFHFRVIKYKNESIEDAEDRYKKQCIHDKMKSKYAVVDNNIDLLRIPYWEFDNIEVILDKYLINNN